MRGFRERVEVSTARAWIDAQVCALPGEDVPVDALGGRVLARAVVAPIDVPAFDRAAMDGYALRAQDTVGASDYHPLEFPVVGETFPARPFQGRAGAGCAVRVMTGAPMPEGLDTVVPAEYAQATATGVEITAASTPGKHVGRRGEDLRAGQPVLPAGRRLRPQDAGLIASLGLDHAHVHRQPRVRLVVTGNEVVAPGQPKGEWDVYDANSAMLRALVSRDGGTIESHRYPGDEAAAIAEAMGAPGADVVLVSGGSSVGAEDHAPRLLAQAGELAVHGVAMRPSSPAGMGRIGERLVFLLPGNPVSCLCAYDFFAGRAIRLLGGGSGEWPYRTIEATVARKIVSAVGRVDYCRVRLGEAGVEPLALSGASILSSTTRADGFVVVPGESEGHGPGTRVTVYLYA
jgi:molybdopterin molybdotransferase